MKKSILLIIALLTFGSGMASDISTFFGNANTFLTKYVKNGRVHYKEIKGNFPQIQKLYNDIGEMELTGIPDDQKKAFYINAYNLVVIYQVSKYYPLKSPLDRSGFFDKVKHKVAGELMTLNSLEIKKLILKYKDGRIHFALACAAMSCPPLANYAYTPDKLEKQLTDRTSRSLNNSSWLKVNSTSKTVGLSKIFDWYNKDFTMNGKDTVLDFINRYRSRPIPSNYMTKFYEYDWSLNDG